MRLFLWEALRYRENDLPNEEERAAHYRAKVADLGAVMGGPPEEVARTLLTLIGLAAWPNAVPQMSRLITGVSTEDSSFTEDMRAHIVGFTADVLRQRGISRVEPADQPRGSRA